MNLKKTVLLLLLAALFTLKPQAQDRKFGLKIYPIPLIVGKTPLQAELMVSPYRSITLDFSNRNLNLDDGFIANVIEENVDEPVSGSFKSLLINPSFRMYSKKKEGPRGGYFAAGIRYNSADADIVIDLDDYPGSRVGFTSSMMGVTLDLGVQWLIGNRVSVDWNILGVGLQYGNISGSVTSANLTAQEAQDLADDLNGELDGIPLVNIEFSATDNIVSMDANQVLPFLRSRFSLGIFF
ncbi:MAG: DUF3575 domain-containing protein [Bacteroidia bacterium]|nr:DUF3575 domain-containing protein [Bacteroidia bacterium]